MKFLVILVSFVSVIPVKSQILAKHGLLYRNSSYEVFYIALDSSVGKKLTIVQNDNRLPESVYFNEPMDQSNFFAITASITDSGGMPLGLYLVDGKLIRDINRSQGNGNFYLKPNGWIGVDTAGTVLVRSTDRYAGDGLRTAIQSGPMLIVDGAINGAFGKNSPNRAMRCGVGELKVHGKRWLVFIKSNNPVTFYELATVFKEKYGCENALNLESGAFCSIHLPALPGNYSSKQIVRRYLRIDL